ncbi:hypothetical protein ABLB69_18770 [Xenorhabdus khoisanae]|uniref:hypothetical protein n=1 Tax=Xenorhabdus khoisanae TaxID=880157 RepID=UPI0032B78431
MSLSIITKIISRVPNQINIIVGEDDNKTYVIESNDSKTFNIRAPWIGRQDEAWKAIRLVIDNGIKVDIIWIFQDYNSSNSNVMYCVGDEFQYKNEKTTHEIDGFNKDGGNKILLIVKTDDSKYNLRMI